MHYYIFGFPAGNTQYIIFGLALKDIINTKKEKTQ